MPVNLERRVDRLEDEAGVRAVDQAEIERMRTIFHACDVVENFPSRATEEDRAIVASTSKEEQGEAFVFIMSGKGYPGGFTAMVTAACAIPRDEIESPEWMQAGFMKELDEKRPDLSERVRRGKLTIDQATNIRLREWHPGAASHVPSGPPEEPAYPPRPEVSKVLERRGQARSNPMPELAQQPQRPVFENGPRRLPDAPAFDVQAAIRRDMEYADLKRRQRAAASQEWRPPWRS